MVAEDALSSLFTTRQEVYHSIEFEGILRFHSIDKRKSDIYRGVLGESDP